MSQTDLFALGLDRAMTPAERRRFLRSSPKPSGYAWSPGTGPEGETCKTCKHIYRRRMGRVYLKCGLARQNWTRGGATDILASSPACRKWEAR